MMRTLVGALLLGVAVSGSLVATARAQTVTGTYSVILRTERGSCDQRLSWTVGVSGGHILERGLFHKVTGEVSDAGGVSLTVTSGRDVLTAAGTLSQQGGNGTWTSPTRNCSGRWSAVAA